MTASCAHDYGQLRDRSSHRSGNRYRAIRFGTYVALADGACTPDPGRMGKGGIAKRPYGAGSRETYAVGDQVVILTDGGVLAELSEGLRWVDVASGRVVEAAQS